MTGNTVPSRRHTHCPESLGIEWPYYLEVKLSHELSLKRKRDNDATSSATAADDEALARARTGAGETRTTPKATTPKTIPAQDSGSGLPKDDMDSLKATLARIGKQHAAFDRLNREGKGVVSASSTHKNTKGSQIHHDLDSLLKACEATDSHMLAFERDSTQCPTRDHIAQLPTMSSRIDELAMNMKKARKCMSAIRGLWKL